MKKLSLLLGTLGGAVAGYLFSNNKLRDELGKAKSTEAAAKILARHLQSDGSKVGAEIQSFIRSEPVQQKFSQAKEYAKKELQVARQELKKLVDQGKSQVKKATDSLKKKPAKKTTKTANPKSASR